MGDTFTMEVDDSEILLGNGRVDLSAYKWCHTVCELQRAHRRIEKLEQFSIDLSEWVWGEFEERKDRPMLVPLLKRAIALDVLGDKDE